MKKLSIFLFSMLIAITGFCYTVSDKIALEKVYSERVERVLENIIGKGKVFVYINLELDSMQRQEQRETYTYINANGSGGRPETAKKWLFEEKNSGPAQYYLPGYPVEGGQARQPVNPEMREKIIEQTTDVPGTVIKRADVTILIEPGVKEDIVKSIPRTTAGLLGLSKARGDTIAVRRIPFPPPSQTFVEQFKKPEIIVDVSKYLLISIMFFLSIMAFLLLSKDFLKNVGMLVQALRPRLEVAVAQKSEENVTHGGEIKSETSIEGKKLPGNIPHGESKVISGEPDKENRRFGFIDEKNIKRLSLLIKNEPVENIALTVSYLNPRHASLVLSSLEPAVRSAVTNSLLKTIEASPSAVQNVEEAIKNKINYLLGGNEFMLEVLDYADNDTRETLLADVSSQDREVAQRLRSGLFLFSDIENLKDNEIKKLIDSLDNETLAVALRNAPETIFNKFLGNISAGAQANLKQMMDLMGPQPQNKIKDARNRIVSTIRHLINEGVIIKPQIKRG